MSMTDLRANLCTANLHGADLRAADMSGANLMGANLEEANLTGANLNLAITARARMRGAIDKTGKHSAVVAAASGGGVKTAVKPIRPWWQFWG